MTTKHKTSPRRFYLMNMLLILLTLIAIVLFDRTLGKAFDSQRSSKDIFQEDSRGMQRAKEMLSSDQANFYTNPRKSETNDSVPLSIDSLSQSQMTSLPSCSFLSQMTSLQSQLQVSSSFMSQRLQHLLILGLATIPCPFTSILSTLLWLQYWLSTQQLWQRIWTQVLWIQRHKQQVSFCFATKTTQKLWFQVSCSLLIRTTQQLRRQLTHRIFCFMPKSVQQLRRRPTHRISCCFSFETIQPIPSFIWLLRSFEGLRLPNPMLILFQFRRENILSLQPPFATTLSSWLIR